MAKRIDISTPSSPDTYAIVDDEDYERVISSGGRRWHARQSGDCMYAVRKVEGSNCVELMHRVITFAPDGVYVDHINANTLDNRKYNLRHCRKIENQYNAKKRSDNTSGYKGVTRRSKRKARPWQAEIRADGIRYYLGSFNTPEAAARAYDAAALKYHGEFARTNKMMGLL